MTQLLKSISAIFILITLAACVPEQVSKLEFKKQAWSAVSPSHYEFTVHDNCGNTVCTMQTRPVYTVEIKDGQVVKTVNNESYVAGNTAFKWADTFDNIFDRVITQVLNNPNEVIEYNEPYNFITSALDFTISDFKILDSTVIISGTPLEQATQVWSLQKPNNYTFTVHEKICNSMPICDLVTILVGYNVSVKNNEVIELTSLTGEVIPVEYYSSFKWVQTMDELLNRANEDVNAPDTSEFINLNESLKFDAQYGYIKESAYYTVTSFRIN